MPILNTGKSTLINLEKLNIWAGLVANLGVIAGIVFLAIELNQNSNMMAAQTRTSITQEIIESMERERDPVLQEAFRRSQAGEPLNSEQSLALTVLIAQRLRHWENVLYQYDMGLFDEGEFSGILAYIRAFMSTQAAKDLWSQQRAFYSSRFQVFIDSVIDN
ncbi:MAG: hypothetical protein WDZ52_00395 [Pseudohongiellaceae bacterium]